MGIDQQINAFFEPIANGLASVVFYSVNFGEGLDVKLILVWLVVAALFFTVHFGFINFRYFMHAVRLVCRKPDDSEKGQISSFQALMTSMAATVGLGNIAGVAVAISVGGPGAALWMVVMGFFGMSVKFAEVMAGVKYRHYPDPDRPDEVYGGPMYYIRDAFANRAIPHVGIGRFTALVFAAFTMIGALGAAALFQTNQSFQQLLNVTGGDTSYFADKAWMFGLFMVVIAGVVIIGGIKSIANVSGKVVPLMAGLYILMGIVVLVLNFSAVPGALVVIIKGAFTPAAGFGAVLGTILTGVQRASFSNEAGLGSAAISQSSVRTKDPVEQGFVGMLGPFIDTVVVCSVTAIVIVVTGVYDVANGVEGVELTSRAFGSVISWFPILLAVIVFMFAYSTIIGWYYIGMKGFAYIFGERRIVEHVYQFIFCVFIVIGAASTLDNIITFTDASILAMAVPNLIGLYLLAPELKRDLREYIEKLKT